MQQKLVILHSKSMKTIHWTCFHPGPWKAALVFYYYKKPLLLQQPSKGDEWL